MLLTGVHRAAIAAAITAMPIMGTLASADAASDRAATATNRPTTAYIAARTGYTHATALKLPSCPIYHNYPKRGVPARSWTKPAKNPRGRTYHVGVRYTYKRYALVLDYARSKQPLSWGFIARSCLADPYAYSKGAGGGNRLPDLKAPGGGMVVKSVPISAPHQGKTKRKLIHAGSAGTLRSGRKSFVIGNVQKGDGLRITRRHCRKRNPSAWVLGYAPSSGRWGYVQARHLPACLG